jgi:hypothetical protein
MNKMKDRTKSKLTNIALLGIALGLIGGLGGCVTGQIIYNTIEKSEEAAIIRPKVKRIEQVERQLYTLDRNRYLLTEYESLVKQREDLQNEYDSFMEDPANRAVYTQYKNPERLRPKSANLARKVGLGSFGIAGLSVLSLFAIDSIKTKKY